MRMTPTSSTALQTTMIVHTEKHGFGHGSSIIVSVLLSSCCSLKHAHTGHHCIFLCRCEQNLICFPVL